MSSQLKVIQAQILPILKKYDIKKASFFGSILREDFQSSRSDIDILVKFGSDQSLFGYLKLKVELEKKLKKTVDIVEYDALKPRIKNQVLSSAISIL